MKNKFLFLGIICLVFITIGLYFFYHQSIKIENHKEEIKTLSVKVLKKGHDKSIEEGDKVTINFTVWFEDGTRFQSTSDWDKPYTFTFGSGRVIKGLEKGILGAKIGEKRQLKIPYNLAYGEKGIVLSSGDVVVPPETSLIMEVEIVNVE